MLSWGKENQYIERLLRYFLARCADCDCLIVGAFPGSVGPKAFTIGEENTTLKKIQNYEFRITYKNKYLFIIKKRSHHITNIRALINNIGFTKSRTITLHCFKFTVRQPSVIVFPYDFLSACSLSSCL